MFHGEISKETAQGLIELRKRIQAANIPPSQLDETLNIASWNIRAFGKGQRRPESLHYIAEILGQFDLICIVELCDDLRELQTVLSYLGPTWKAIFSDYNLDAGGNRERLGFVYDERAVRFTGLAAEAGAPRTRKGDEYVTDIDFWRSPFMASFQAGDFDFILLSAHIRWGDTEENRKVDLGLMADWVDTRVKEKTGWDKDILVMGDFNIPSLDSPLYEAVTSKGLKLVAPLARQSFGSNLAKDKRYDQILHYPTFTTNVSELGGVLDFYLNAKAIPALYPNDPPKPQKFTFEMSDHLPIWVQLKTDVDAEKLDRIFNQTPGPVRTRAARR